MTTTLPGFTTLLPLAAPVQAGVTYNPVQADSPGRRGRYIQRSYAIRARHRPDAIWAHHCAPAGAQCAHPDTGVQHGPRVCGPSTAMVGRTPEQLEALTIR
jgi:hypothetical protein